MSRRSVLWDWPLVSRLESPCRLESDRRCALHGLRRELSGSGQCQVGKGAEPMMRAILGARRQAGPRELAQLAGAARTELDALAAREAAFGALGECPAAVERAIAAASRRVVPMEEVISWVATWDEFFAIRRWLPLALDRRGNPRDDLRDQAELRMVSLYPEIERRTPPGAARLARWTDTHFWFYWSFASPWHETGGQLFEAAVMLSRDGGYLLGADTALVSAAERLAEEVLAAQEAGISLPAWRFSTVPGDPYPRFTRPSDLLATEIATAAGSTQDPARITPATSEDAGAAAAVPSGWSAPQ